jgi:hypothetical protein
MMKRPERTENGGGGRETERDRERDLVLTQRATRYTPLLQAVCSNLSSKNLLHIQETVHYCEQIVSPLRQREIPDHRCECKRQDL